MQTADAEALVQSYLDAFAARDLSRCLGMFDESAVLDFPPGTFKGKQALEEWHQARFAANMQIVSVDKISAAGDTITIEGTITSKRLHAWHINHLAGNVVFQLRDGLISHARFGMGSFNPIKAFR